MYLGWPEELVVYGANSSKRTTTFMNLGIKKDRVDQSVDQPWKVENGGALDRHTDRANGTFTVLNTSLSLETI